MLKKSNMSETCIEPAKLILYLMILWTKLQIKQTFKTKLPGAIGVDSMAGLAHRKWRRILHNTRLQLKIIIKGKKSLLEE